MMEKSRLLTNIWLQKGTTAYICVIGEPRWLIQIPTNGYLMKVASVWLQHYSATGGIYLRMTSFTLLLRPQTGLGVMKTLLFLSIKTDKMRDMAECSTWCWYSQSRAIKMDAYGHSTSTSNHHIPSSHKCIQPCLSLAMPASIEV